MKSNDNITLDMVNETRKVRDQFFKTISDYTTDLWNYCKYITGSPWDGEDLYQETIIKSFGFLPQRWGEKLTKNIICLRLQQIPGLTSAES